jgi:hypothetical protein
MIDALCVTLIGVPCTFMQTRAHAAGRSRAVRVYVQKCPAGGPLPVHCTADDRSGEGSLLGRVASRVGAGADSISTTTPSSIKKRPEAGTGTIFPALLHYSG